MGLDQSNLYYNGINLFIVKTNRFEQKPIYSGDGIDYMYTEFTLDVNCIYNPGATSYDDSNPPEFTPGIFPSATNESIRHWLLQPRQKLLFSGLFNPIISSPEIEEGIDANNGPVPLACTVFQIALDRTFHVHYVIKTWLIECPNNNDDALLTNRWSQTSTIDFQRLMVRRTSGIAYFRTDILQSEGTFVDQFRSQIIAPIPPKPGFYREEMNFAINPQGNTISYEIVDIERMYNLGDTIKNNTYVMKVEGSFSQGTMADEPGVGAAAGKTLARMTVKIWGSQEADNWTLCQIAFKVMAVKLPVSEVGANAILKDIQFTQDISNAYIELTMAIQVNLKQGTLPVAFSFDPIYLKDSGGMRPPNLYFDPTQTGINPGLQNDVGSRGSDAVFLRSSLIKQACAPQDTPQPNTQGSGTGEQEEYGDSPNITVIQQDILTPNPTFYQGYDFPYNSYSTESTWEYESGSVQAPIANPNNPGSNQQSIQGPYQCEILNFCAPYSNLIVEWRVERISTPPDIPHFIRSIQCLQDDQQAVLKRAYVKPYSESLDNSTQTRIFSVSGTYEYMIPYSTDPTSPPIIVFDTPPTITDQFGDFSIAGDQSGSCVSGQLQGNYIHGIIDSGQQDQGQGQDQGLS